MAVRYIYIYATMKTMFPQDFRSRGSVEILTLVHVLYGYIYKIHALSLSLKTIFFSDIFQNAQISLTHNLFQKVKCLPTLSKSRKRVIGVSLRAFS